MAISAGKAPRPLLHDSPISSLPDSLLLEIFFRLSCAKDAFRCRAVCKHWRCLISSPEFVRSKNDLRFSLVVLSDRGKLVLSSQDPIFKSRGFDLTYFHALQKDESGEDIPLCPLATHMDLLLCSRTVADHSAYYICNPVTMQWVCLPPTPNFLDQRAQVALICEPSHEGGEGSGVNPQYKYTVFRIMQLLRTTALVVQTFSSEAKQWKRLFVPNTRGVREDGSLTRPVVCKGMLHWLADANSVVVAYDPKSLQLQFLDFPREVNVKFNSRKSYSSECLGVCKNSLRILQLSLFPRRYKRFHSHTLFVWELEDHTTSKWRLRHKAFFKDMGSDSLWLEKIVRGSMSNVGALGVHAVDENIVFLRFFNRIVCCNLRERKLEMVANMPGNHGGNRVLQLLLPWWPTPVPPLLPDLRSL